jgi:hypothetical protein
MALAETYVDLQESLERKGPLRRKGAARQGRFSQIGSSQPQNHTCGYSHR